MNLQKVCAAALLAVAVQQPVATPASPMLSLASTAQVRLKPLQIYVQAALVGAAVPGSLQAASSALVPGPRYPVTQREMRSAQAALVRAGVRAADIRSRLTTATAATGGTDAFFRVPGSPPARAFSRSATIGQFLIAVRPMTERAVQSTISRLRTVGALRILGFAVRADGCGTSGVQSAALRAASDRARIFAQALGLHSDGIASMRTSAASNEPVLCRAEQWPPVPSVYDNGAVARSQPALHETISVDARVRTGGNLHFPAGSDGRILGASVVPPARSFEGAKLALTLGAGTPYIQAHGVNRILVRPDALLVELLPCLVCEHVELDALAKRLERAGFAARTIREAGSVEYVLAPHPSGDLRRLENALRANHDVDVRVLPVVYECRTYAAAALRGAVQIAHARAAVLAAGAGVPLGALLGIRDAGHDRNAVCAPRDQAEVAHVSAAAAAQQTYLRTSSDLAEFDHVVDVVWQQGAATPQFGRAGNAATATKRNDISPTRVLAATGASPATRFDDAEVYRSFGFSPFESYRVAEFPFSDIAVSKFLAQAKANNVSVKALQLVDTGCISDTLRFLKDTTRAALEERHYARPRALIDLGDTFGMTAQNMCGFSSDVTDADRSLLVHFMSRRLTAPVDAWVRETMRVIW